MHVLVSRLLVKSKSTVHGTTLVYVTKWTYDDHSEMKHPFCRFLHWDFHC